MPDDLAPTRPVNPWVALATVSIGTLMATIDASSVNVALPTIARDFGLSVAQVSWISISYFLVITALLLAIGRLSDLTSRSRVFSLGMGIFGVASGLCAIAPNLGVLVAFRCLEAIGGSMVMANSPALIASAFPGEQRGRVLGTVTLVATVGSSL
ncbi:MAG TPA: MFS transporter, partial [Stenomitos sp.]